MGESLLEQFWLIVGWVCALNGDVFRIASTTPQGGRVALLIVLLAGLSQGIGQSVILFINQVKPIRFMLSLLINALLFVAGFVFLVFSTWLITLLPWSVQVSFGVLLTVLGLSYAPLLFSFLAALPYLGGPLLSLLSVWNLLAINVGFAAVTGVALPKAFGYVAFGWIVLQVLQQTIGRPIANVGRWIADTVAGVDLATDRREVVQMVRERVQNNSEIWKQTFNQQIMTARQTVLHGAPEVSSDRYPPTAAAVATSECLSPNSTGVTVPIIPVAAQGTGQGLQRSLKPLLGILGMALLTVVVLILLAPVRDWWFGWFNHLPGLLQWILNLVWIGVIALIVAGLLAPLETLGWWAGWYEDEVDTTVNAGDLAIPRANTDGIERYIVYLDGIGKSTFEYLPDIEEFLDTLAPTLPPEMALVRGIMPYSVMNQPLDEDRPLAFLWKYADKMRFANPASLLGMLVNIRNVLIVGVSADKRYGPLYNQGIAQVVYNGLVKNGYQPGSGVPITFIGYSGGGQMSCANAPFLKRALSAPIDVISLGGVISANNNILQLEHLYHLVGDKDGVERIGPIMFPGRWRLFPLSYWNRAKRQGKITIVPMGPVGHQVPGGILDPNVTLADGRSALQQTIDTINAILTGELMAQADLAEAKPSHYGLYQQQDWLQPSYYPLEQTVDPSLYRPIADWMGRLILPEKGERSQVRGAKFEVHHAPAEYQHLVGEVVILRWSDDVRVQRLVKAVTKDVHFSADAEHSSRFGGLVHPDRLNHWRRVDPLESLAGSHPQDDLIVMLEQPEVVTPPGEAPVLLLYSQPVEITGRYYGLVQFLAPVAGSDRYRVAHFNRTSRQFDGPEEIVRLPRVMLARDYGSYPSTTQDLEKSPCNETGWYIYGAKDSSGTFVGRSLAPRALWRLQPDRVVFGQQASYRYIRKETWADIVAQKGKIASVLGTGRANGRPSAIQDAIADWQEGDRALVLHTYGGIGGKNAEPAAATPIFFGHFAFGVADVIHDPLADELRFDIRYYQVYTHNTDGLVAGTLHWSRYLGDRQFGWLGNRPTCDILAKLPCFTGSYDFEGDQRSPLYRMEAFLQAMTARYRIGDGTGGTYVGPANNCSQDSNQALFASIQQMRDAVRSNADWIREWAERNPNQAEYFKQLMVFGKDLKSTLQPCGKPRPDWESNEFNLGTTLQDKPLENLILGLSSWRTLLPRKASDTVVKVFLDYGATVWVLRTNQVGGHDPDIEPKAPMTL